VVGHSATGECGDRTGTPPRYHGLSSHQPGSARGLFCPDGTGFGSRRPPRYTAVRCLTPVQRVGFSGRPNLSRGASE